MTPPSPLAPPDTMPSRGTIALLALAAGATVANLYYSQPLLAEIARELHVGPARASAIVTATQVGYAVGLLLLVPLGDRLERRALISTLTFATAGALLATAAAPTLPTLLAASAALGALTVVPQIVVPFAAGLTSAATRGRVVGTVMSGVLVGVLLSRSISGFSASYFGWRATYVAAAFAMVALALGLRVALPRQPSDATESYGALLASLLDLPRREPVLRRHAVVGAFGFGAFGVFWTTLGFHLAALPAHYGTRTVGLFGLLGAAGALAAPLAGRLADRVDARVLNGASLALVAASFALMGAAPDSMVALVLGVVLLDAGVQSSHISNQTRVFALDPALRNRLNALYMVAYFVGGAGGSLLGAAAWTSAGWRGVALAGGLCALGGLIALFTMGRGGSAKPA